jgi:hypothetical protein
MERDVGDVGRPYWIHSCDRTEIHPAWIALGWISWNRGARFLIDRPKPHVASEVLNTIKADWDPFLGQIAHHPVAAAAGILQVETIDPGHDS